MGNHTVLIDGSGLTTLNEQHDQLGKALKEIKKDVEFAYHYLMR